MNSRRLVHVCSMVLLGGLLLSCGGAGDSPAGEFNVAPGLPGGGGGGTGGGGTGGGGGALPGLTGGVLATFSAGGESFRYWVTEPTVAQTLVDAWTGAGNAITRLDAPVLQGQGDQQHNAPWNWYIHPLANGVVFNAVIAPTRCFPYWTKPSEAEAGFAAGRPFPCVDVNAGADWGEIRMNVTLLDIQDQR